MMIDRKAIGGFGLGLMIGIVLTLFYCLLSLKGC